MRGLGNDGTYWEYLNKGQLVLPRCKGCAKWIWPAPHRCADCGGWDFTWKSVALEGEIYSWTRVHHPFGGAEDLGLPYITVSVSLPQAGGIRLFGVVEGDDEPRIGMSVQGRVRTTNAFDREIPALSWRAAQ